MQSNSLGIIGGGQLARMMYQASIGLSIKVGLLSENNNDSAALVMPDVHIGSHLDRNALFTFADIYKNITFDHEHVPQTYLYEIVNAGYKVNPHPDCLVYAQNKILMRQKMQALELPNPNWTVAKNKADIANFAKHQGYPFIIKAPQGGYDGHGVWKISSSDDLLSFYHSHDQTNAYPFILEECIDFCAELSVIVARNTNGQVVCYPVSQSVQENGVCVRTITPAPMLAENLSRELQQVGKKIADALNVTGVLAVELMLDKNNLYYVNELAMRPHNTGHWTIDGAITSQFENHIRGVLGLPLGDASMCSPVVVMQNIFGGNLEDISTKIAEVYAQYSALKVHLYGKEVRLGRKLGHVNLLGDRLESLLRIAQQVNDLLVN